jgi:hypothetical protein
MDTVLLGQEPLIFAVFQGQYKEYILRNIFTSNKLIYFLWEDKRDIHEIKQSKRYLRYMLVYVLQKVPISCSENKIPLIISTFQPDSELKFHFIQQKNKNYNNG